MNRSPLEDARYEIKFVAPITRYRELEHWIHVHPAGFRRAYPPRIVNNVYFDTYDLFTYRENLVGASARSKVRLRWYGKHPTPERTVLEVKRRRNLLGWKLSFPGGPIDFATNSWREIRRRLRESLPETARPWLDAHPQPVLINQYERQYFVSPDGRVRVTLDWKQKVFAQLLSPRPSLLRPTNLPQTIVIEFKFGRGDMRLGSRAIQGIPIRLSRNSKYVIGVQSLLPA